MTIILALSDLHVKAENTIYLYFFSLFCGKDLIIA